MTKPPSGRPFSLISAAIVNSLTKLISFTRRESRTFQIIRSVSVSIFTFVLFASAINFLSHYKTFELKLLHDLSTKSIRYFIFANITKLVNNIE